MAESTIKTHQSQYRWLDPVAWAVMRGGVEYDACFRKREHAEEWRDDRQHRFRRELVVMPLYPHPPERPTKQGAKRARAKR